MLNIKKVIKIFGITRITALQIFSPGRFAIPVVISAIFAAGVLVRLLSYGSIPPGLNQDEASIGYDAYAILKYGIDRNGISLPVHLISWGSGQNALYAYLSIPFIWLFGLNVFSVRAVAAVAGAASLAVFYLLAAEIYGRSGRSGSSGGSGGSGISNSESESSADGADGSSIKSQHDILQSRFATVALFMLAISPWHIMASRWALESNLFPAIFLLSAYFLVLSARKPYFLIPAAFMAAISLYAYGTSYFAVPVFILLLSVCMAIRLIRQRRTGSLSRAGISSRLNSDIRKNYHKHYIVSISISVAVFAITAAPVFLFVLINKYFHGTGQLSFMGFTIPVLTGPARFNEISGIFSDSFLKSAARNLTDFAKLIVTQEDGLIWNSLPFFGYIYVFSLPFTISGIFIVFKKMVASFFDGTAGDCLRRLIMPLWLGAAVLTACVTSINTNRINLIFMPLIYFTASGLWHLIILPVPALKKSRRLNLRLNLRLNPKLNLRLIPRPGSSCRNCKQHIAALVMLFAYTISFFVFSNYYFTLYPDKSGRDFQDSLGPAILSAEATAPPGSGIYITDSISMPYIYVLFYTCADPLTFINTAVYDDNTAAFRQVLSYGRYRFGPSSAAFHGDPAEIFTGAAGAYIFADFEISDEMIQLLHESGDYEIEEFKYYYVVSRKIFSHFP